LWSSRLLVFHLSYFDSWYYLFLSFNSTVLIVAVTSSSLYILAISIVLSPLFVFAF
jgi:hypothetical protein